VLVLVEVNGITMWQCTRPAVCIASVFWLKVW